MFVTNNMISCCLCMCQNNIYNLPLMLGVTLKNTTNIISNVKLTFGKLLLSFKWLFVLNNKIIIIGNGKWTVKWLFLLNNKIIIIANVNEHLSD